MEVERPDVCEVARDDQVAGELGRGEPERVRWQLTQLVLCVDPAPYTTTQTLLKGSFKCDL